MCCRWPIQARSALRACSSCRAKNCRHSWLGCPSTGTGLRRRRTSRKRCLRKRISVRTLKTSLLTGCRNIIKPQAKPCSVRRPSTTSTLSRCIDGVQPTLCLTNQPNIGARLMNAERSDPLAREQTELNPIDRYESTFVVSPDPSKGDFTNLQDAINALPSTGGKIFVKAGVYTITSTIQVTTGNVQIQGEGMGITVFMGDSSMTGNTPALEIYNSAVGTARVLVADTARGDLTVKVSPADATSFSPGDYVLLYSNKEID